LQDLDIDWELRRVGTRHCLRDYDQTTASTVIVLFFKHALGISSFHWLERGRVKSVALSRVGEWWSRADLSITHLAVNQFRTPARSLSHLNYSIKTTIRLVLRDIHPAKLWIISLFDLRAVARHEGAVSCLVTAGTGKCSTL
jgi:hypothetical protein